MILGIFGSGGFGREVMPIAKKYSNNLFFVEKELTNSTINGYKTISEYDFFNLPNYKTFNVAIGNSKIREKIVHQCLSRGMAPISLHSEHGVIYEDTQIGQGLILCPFSIITSNTKIGMFFHANLYSYVAHDCIIGDFVTFAPGVKCNGNVHIKDHVYVGANAVIRNGTNDNPIIIGEGATIGMGAVVTKNVPPYTTVVGNPAKPLIK
jgi:sugar O-acyltransferase (sialic acid O-acetyltransferase NeuD family)